MDERIIKLIGNENLKKIKEATVCVVGLGGVGGYVVESLVRSGIEHFVFVDYDKVDITNLNSQIVTNINNIGCYKVDEMEKRILSINSDCNIIKVNSKLDEDNVVNLFEYSFDYLVDACDAICVKERLIQECLDRDIKFISSMGTGNKLNPLELRIADIRKTSYDPIAKKIRKYVFDHHIRGKIPVVYSCEKREKFQGSIPSMMFVPAVSGIMCANYIIKEIISLKQVVFL